jgi:hypothetical protein
MRNAVTAISELVAFAVGYSTSGASSRAYLLSQTQPTDGVRWVQEVGKWYIDVKGTQFTAAPRLWAKFVQKNGTYTFQSFEFDWLAPTNCCYLLAPPLPEELWNLPLASCE